MNDEPTDFDLKFMPDWLKEAPAKNPYADYQSKEYDRPRKDFNSQRPPSRPGQNNNPRGDRKPGGQGNRNDKPRDDRRGVPSKPNFSNRSRDDQRGPQRPPTPPVEAAPVNIEFFPESNCVASIAKQIKTTSHACPLFSLAKMFLAKPERHRVKISSTDSNIPLFQCGENGPIALDRGILEKNAFTTWRDHFYSKETIQREPLKGNFNNVARCRLSGKLLGPTSYHAYQPTLRKLYEERFSRRMSFQEYLKEIETTNSPEAIEAWKEEARNVTTYKTITEAEPLVFESASDVEQHFRKNYLTPLIKQAQSFEVSGEISRSLPDRRIAASVKKAWEKELQFPGQLMHHLRRELTEVGLHIFKHRKRIQYISVIRPDRFKGSTQVLSENIAVILSTIEATPKCTRVDLANKIFQSKLDSPELPKLKAGLAADLHWLTQAGHVIEFQDGKLDLPLAPKQLENEVAGPEEPVPPVKTEALAPETPTPEAQVPETPTLESAPEGDPE